jgi:hypothetical protein
MSVFAAEADMRGRGSRWLVGKANRDEVIMAAQDGA